MHTKLNFRMGLTAAALALAGWMQILSSGCVAEGGGGGGGDVVYDDEPWIQGDVFVDGGGPGWYGRHDDSGRDHDRGYVHPNAGGHPAQSHPAESHAAPAAHASVGAHEPERR